MSVFDEDQMRSFRTQIGTDAMKWGDLLEDDDTLRRAAAFTAAAEAFAADLRDAGIERGAQMGTLTGMLALVVYGRDE